MCGIVGYTGNANVQNTLVNGLKKLEYRGYDSAGIAGIHNNNFCVVKSKGQISFLENKINENNFKIESAGIGHTRWATHGEPCERNAHPHISENIVLVHNGIIENYVELKELLSSKGIEFYSETDTEVACKYINYIYETEKNKIACIKRACETLRGAYGFAIIFKDEPNAIYGVRLNSPLVLGLSDNSNFIASDVSAFLSSTNKYILLEHNEYAKITDQTVEIFNNNLELISKEVLIADWEDTHFEKNGYDHFMLKEIHEQPAILKKLFNRYFEKKSLLNNIRLKDFRNIQIVACGSAMHAGMVGKYLFEEYAEIPTTVEIASEYRYKKQLISDKTLVIIVSQSGETADTLAALRIAKEQNATVLSIVNVIGSSIARESDHVIYTHAGPEIAVATTKGYTSQMGVFITLALDIIKETQDISQIEKELANIDILINNVLEMEQDFAKSAAALKDKLDLFFVGRAIDYSLCLEGSLKLKEISYIHSEAYAAGELKHGSIALVDKGTPIIALATNKDLFDKTISNIKETKARGAYVIFITTEELDTNDDFYDIKYVLPTSSPFAQSLTASVALQLISYYTAKLRGCDIDKPKNLAKSVTVE